MNLKQVWPLLKDTVSEWQEDKVSLWAAALAYYTIFSLAPLLIIAIAIAGVVFGEEAARGDIVRQIQGLIGRDGAEAIQTMIENANQPASGGVIATTFGVITLLFGASGVFTQMKDALNAIWDVKPNPNQGVKGMVYSKFLSFAMVLVIGFLLLVSLVLSAGLAAVGNWFGHLLPGAASLWQLVNFAVSFGVITVLFAMIYKFLPDVKVPWSDLWIGAAVTSLLFTIGKFLIGLYLGNSGVGSTYGAAGSLVVVLLWVYYSAQIVMFGAEFTQVYAKKHGSRIVPTKNAVPVEAAVGSGGSRRSSSGSGLSVEEREPADPPPARSQASPPYGRYATAIVGSVIAWLSLARRSNPSRHRRRRR